MYSQPAVAIFSFFDLIHLLAISTAKGLSAAVQATAYSVIIYHVEDVLPNVEDPFFVIFAGSEIESSEIHGVAVPRIK